MYLLQKGQQIKCFSQLSKEAREKGYLIPLAEERDKSNFKGAIVLEPVPGEYDTPVAVLDFASLYPSIQMAYQVCYTTIVLDTELHNRLMQLKSENKPLEERGVKFDIIEWVEEEYVYRNKKTNSIMKFYDEDEAKKITPRKQIRESIARNNDSDIITWRIEKTKHAYAFAQGQQSLIPDLQYKLKASRKTVKRMMAPIEYSKDPDKQLRYRVLNGRQLAIKVSMNSLYGFTGAFMMNLQALSAAVTAKGRQLIEQTKDFMENKFEKIAKERIWTIEDEYTFFSPDGKEIIARTENINGIETWILDFNGKELATSPVGVIPKNEDGKTWIKKYPTAVAGKPWTEHDLNIRVVAGDTDSAFANFPTSCLAECVSLCHKAADLLTDTEINRKPIEMEYEKTYFPLFIQMKKNYVGIKYEMDDVRWKIDYKGIAVKKRNYCDFVKQVFWSVIYPALGIEPYYNKDGKQELRKVEWNYNLRSEKAIEALKQSLQKLTLGQVSIDDLVISASLKSNYKGKKCSDCQGQKLIANKKCRTCGGDGIIVNLPHVQLAKRMKQRDEGSAPISGQRFGFIVVNDDSRPNELSARTEDPKYAKKNNLLPDYLYYLNQQIRKPVTRFLNLLNKSEETENVFSMIQNELFAELQHARRKREYEVRKSFFNMNGKRPNPVERLKSPKKPVLNKNKKDGMKNISEYFMLKKM
jgi:DNA polymerase elongation subunit (family B)